MVGKVAPKVSERRSAAKRPARAARPPEKPDSAPSSAQPARPSGGWNAAVEQRLAQIYFRTRPEEPPVTVPRRRSPLVVAGVSLCACVVGVWVIVGSTRRWLPPRTDRAPVVRQAPAISKPPSAVERRQIAQDVESPQTATAHPQAWIPHRSEHGSQSVPKLTGQELLQYITFPHGPLSLVKQDERDVWVCAEATRGAWRGGFLPAVSLEPYQFVNVKMRTWAAAPTHVSLEFKQQERSLLSGPGGKLPVSIPPDGQWHVFSWPIPRRLRGPMNYFAISDPTGPFELASVSASERPLGIVSVSHWSGVERWGYAPGVMTVWQDFDHPMSDTRVGAWLGMQSDATQSCRLSYSDTRRRGGQGYGLAVDYDVDSPRPASVGVRITVPAKRWPAGDALTFWIAGDADAGSSTTCIVELQTDRGRSRYHLDGITDQWQQAVIPLERFTPLPDDAVLHDILLLFEDWNVTRKEGRVYVEEVALLGAP